jgi:hypothetical protein
MHCAKSVLLLPASTHVTPGTSWGTQRQPAAAAAVVGSWAGVYWAHH